jgi:RND family efflux transporter MFP subunit
MSKGRDFLKVIIPVLIILSGIAIMAALMKGRPEPKKEVKKDPGIIVRLLEVKKSDTEIIVKGTGTVKASQEVSIIPQVSGRVTSLSPNLAVGGFFKKGEILLEIEDTDYILALEHAKADMANAEYELAKIESRALIAREEWQRLNLDNKTSPNPLVLYDPQLKNSRAALASAQAAVEQTKLDLSRTRIKAPFNSRISSENIDIGQFIRSGNSVAVLSGTDEAEIEIPLPSEDLRWLNIPAQGKRSNGPHASVNLDAGGTVYEWKGRVIRSTGEVDTRSRMMKVVVGVKDPYGLKDSIQSDRPALASGSFVDVLIEGRALKDVIVIPRIAFRDDSTVWVMNKDQRLTIKKVLPVRIKKDSVIIGKGLDTGDMLVLTNISGAADGMKLRKIND